MSKVASNQQVFHFHKTLPPKTFPLRLLVIFELKFSQTASCIQSVFPCCAPGKKNVHERNSLKCINISAITLLQSYSFQLLISCDERVRNMKREKFINLYFMFKQNAQEHSNAHTHTHSHGLTLCCTISALDLRPRRAGFIFLRMQNALQYSNSDIILYSLVYFLS